MSRVPAFLLFIGCYVSVLALCMVTLAITSYSELRSLVQDSFLGLLIGFVPAAVGFGFGVRVMGRKYFASVCAAIGATVGLLVAAISHPISNLSPASRGNSAITIAFFATLVVAFIVSYFAVDDQGDGTE